jgi:hypothetical protein
MSLSLAARSSAHLLDEAQNLAQPATSWRAHLEMDFSMVSLAVGRFLLLQHTTSRGIRTHLMAFDPQVVIGQGWTRLSRRLEDSVQRFSTKRCTKRRLTSDSRSGLSWGADETAGSGR